MKQIYTKIINEHQRKELDSVPLETLREYKKSLIEYKPSDGINKQYEVNIALSYINNLIEIRNQEDLFRASSLSISHSTLRISRWTLVAAIIAIIITAIGIIINQFMPSPSINKNIPNQQVEPIVKTPVDIVEAQSTQAHP